MDHVYYLDKKTGEYQSLINGLKTMLCFGINRQQTPYNRIFIGDRIFFVDNSKNVLLKSEVVKIEYFDKLSKNEIGAILDANMDELRLQKMEYKRLRRKSFLVLISISDVEKLCK